MKGSVKIVGTNSTTKHLQNILFENSSLETKGKLHDLYLNNEKYLLDIKETYFHEKYLMVFGVISDDDKFVGNVALEFHQKINLD